MRLDYREFDYKPPFRVSPNLDYMGTHAPTSFVPSNLLGLTTKHTASTLAHLYNRASEQPQRQPMGNGSHRATCGVWEWWPGSFTRASHLPPHETISSRTGCVTNPHSRASKSEGTQMGLCVAPCLGRRGAHTYHGLDAIPRRATRCDSPLPPKAHCVESDQGENTYHLFSNSAVSEDALRTAAQQAW